MNDLVPDNQLDTTYLNDAPENIQRKTIAFFSGSPGSNYSYEKWDLWRGLSERARELNANLIYVSGEEFLKSPQAALYDLIGSHNVDGIIFWNSFTSARLTIHEIVGYIQRFHPLPMVSLEREVPGCANIMVDNRQGIREVIAHLNSHHGYQKIGFISETGDITAETRRAIFVDEMEKAGLLDPQLVGSLEDLTQRGLIAGIDYQALLIQSDFIAITTIETLVSNGVRVPEDVAIVGVNDGRDARGNYPPLTTLRLPFRRMGRKSVSLIMDMIAGEERETLEPLPMRLILRRSCGCLEPLAEQAAVGLASGKLEGKVIWETLRKRKDEISSQMLAGMGVGPEVTDRNWADEMYDILTIEISELIRNNRDTGNKVALQKMYDLLQQARTEGVNTSRWHDALTILRGSLVPNFSGAHLAAVEDLFQQVRVMIGQSAMRAEIHRNWLGDRRNRILREIETALLICFDSKEIDQILADGLKKLGIHDFYLVVYDEPAGQVITGRLLLAYRSGRVDPVSGQDIRFELEQLLPGPYMQSVSTFSMLVEALHLGEEQIGYIVFQNDPPLEVSDCDVFTALRIQLSSAIKAIRLREQLYAAMKEAEAADQLKSRFLSMVSHELRTPLNLIVGLSEMAMRQQGRGSKQSQWLIRKYNEQIYISGQHLDRLIRDVLDLASSQVGQIKLVNKWFDIVPELHAAAEMGIQLAEQKRLQFIHQIPEMLPLFWGDKTRIRQILLNLLSNAVKFTSHGEVVFIVERKDNDLHVMVRDTGLGISREDQDKIFDEFQQSDRSIGLGYAGIGLGLAITRKLVEMHRGKIWVTSSGSEGSGSCFELTLPFMVGSLDEPRPELQVGEGKVLIFSGPGGSSKKLEEYLQRQGFHAASMMVSDKNLDIDLWMQSPPGAIVLDMAPAMEIGWEIIKRLKETPATQDIPVLFYSLMIEQDRGSVVEMDYMHKPVGMYELVDVLKRHGLKTGRANEVTLLIADDDPGILDLHTQMVRTFLPDCRVFTAMNGLKVLDIVRSNRVDLVLLDLLMPDLDGFGVIKMMHEDPALRNIPVVVLSGQVLTKRDMMRLNQGVATVLRKGLFSGKEVLQRIEMALSRNQRLGSEGQRLVHQAMGFIHEQYQAPISRADIANHLNVNEQYLSRCFNKEIGIGPMAYLSRYRIEQAKQLLQDGRFSITQVALEVGLSSQSYFSRIFQQETGLSPTAYQRSIGKR